MIWAGGMWRLTGRGSTGFYDLGWWDVAGKVDIYVGLRVAEEG